MIYYKIIFLMFTLFGYTFSNESIPNRWERLTDEINSSNATWKASLNFPPDTSIKYISGLLGTFMDYDNVNNEEFSRYFDMSNSEIPETFDAREKWPYCRDLINHIRDQGACGSCWAIAAAATFSDRICVATEGKVKHPISTEDILACTCVGGCYGGWPFVAWFYIKHRGSVSGGDYGSEEGCKPYSLQPCNHHGNGTRPKCQDLIFSTHTPKCLKTCSNKNYQTPLQQDLIKAKHYYSVSGEINMQKAILSGGSLEATFIVFEDFPLYSSGVYSRTNGYPLGGHAVKVFGWGEENGVKYWLCSNSWNTDWGDNGFFKIKRGSNECFIETSAYFGIL